MVPSERGCPTCLRDGTRTWTLRIWTRSIQFFITIENPFFTPSLSFCMFTLLFWRGVYRRFVRTCLDYDSTWARFFVFGWIILIFTAYSGALRQKNECEMSRMNARSSR